MENRKSIARYHNTLLITSCGKREWNSIGRKTGSVTGYDEAIRCTEGKRLCVRGLLKRFRDINRLYFKIVARDDDVRRILLRLPTRFSTSHNLIHEGSSQ